MEEIAKDNKAMGNVIVTLREMSADEAERRLAEAREKEERDRRGAYITGIIEGEARGEARARQETALRMKASGYPVSEISEITGLTLSEVENL